MFNTKFILCKYRCYIILSVVSNVLTKIIRYKCLYEAVGCP